ncbi:hypothetical protein HDU78_000751, partial [Chytriomyces hyalinus]
MSDRAAAIDSTPLAKHLRSPHPVIAASVSMLDSGMLSVVKIRSSFSSFSLDENELKPLLMDIRP